MSLARPAFTSAEIELEVPEPCRLMNAIGSAAQVGVQERASGIDHPLEELLLSSLRMYAGSVRIAVSDRRTSGIDEQGVREAGVSDRSGKSIDRRRARRAWFVRTGHVSSLPSRLGQLHSSGSWLAPTGITSTALSYDMGVIGYLFLAFIVVPVVEIFMITQVASQLGWFPTIVLVIGVSMVGAWLVKREGLGVMGRVRAGTATGKLPTNELADGAMIFFASALMLTPGFITDFIGLALLIPPIRAVLRPPIISYFKKRLEVRTAGFGGAAFGASRSAGFGRPTPGFGRDVFDAGSKPKPMDADLTDITPEPPELSE